MGKAAAVWMYTLIVAQQSVKRGKRASTLTSRVNGCKRLTLPPRNQLAEKIQPAAEPAN